MQPWDIVQVTTEGEHEWNAGTVIRVDKEKDLVTVKLDNVDDPVVFAVAELKLLGR